MTTHTQRESATLRYLYRVNRYLLLYWCFRYCTVKVKPTNLKNTKGCNSNTTVHFQSIHGLLCAMISNMDEKTKEWHQQRVREFVVLVKPIDCHVIPAKVQRKPHHCLYVVSYHGTTQAGRLTPSVSLHWNYFWLCNNQIQINDFITKCKMVFKLGIFVTINNDSPKTCSQTNRSTVFLKVPEREASNVWPVLFSYRKSVPPWYLQWNDLTGWWYKRMQLVSDYLIKTYYSKSSWFRLMSQKPESKGPRLLGRALSLNLNIKRKNSNN